MLCRFSSRLAVSNTQRAVAVSSLPANLWVSRRWASESKKEEPKKEEPKKEEAKKEEAKPEGEKKAQDAKTFENQAELQDKIKALEKEREELKKELAYALADGENARRIGREDTEKAKNFAVTGFAKSMLEVSDTLERAIENLEKLPQEMVDGNKSLAAVLTGVKMSGSVLLSVFGKNGIEKMESKVGDKFDPNFHDAIFNAPATDKAPAGTLINVVKCGYKIKERVLRAAQVGVAEEQK